MGYKVKPPKCSCVFWRHERRVKKAPNLEIIELKREMKKLIREIQTIDSTVSAINRIHRDGRICLSGVAPDLERLANTRYRLILSRQDAHKQCLALRHAERTV